MSEQTLEQPALPVPQVVVREKVDPSIAVDPQQIAQTMHELGISDKSIAQTTIVLDDKPRLGVRGSHTPKGLHRARHGSQDINEGPGSLVKLTTVYRGKVRPSEGINGTLVHELEHVAQTERRDPRMFLGVANILGGMALGAVVGNKLGKRTGSRLAQAAGTFVGAKFGQALAYKYAAPHEHQARVRAEQVSTQAISSKR